MTNNQMAWCQIHRVRKKLITSPCTERFDFIIHGDMWEDTQKFFLKEFPDNTEIVDDKTIRCANVTCHKS